MTVVRKILEGTLTAGSTSLSFTDTLIPNSILKVTTNNTTVFPTSQSVSGNTLQLTFTAQSSNIGVSLEIIKQGLDIVDDLISTDADKALSAKQGKVLKDAVDAIVIPEVPDVINSLESESTTDALSAYQGKVLKDDIDSIVIPTVPDELNDLDDVNITSPSNGQVIKYNSVSEKWENGSASGGSLGFINLADNLYDSGNITSNFANYSYTVLSDCWMQGNIKGNGTQSAQIYVNGVMSLANMVSASVTGYIPVKAGDELTLRNISGAEYYIRLYGFR